jgi:hypothetical protein
MELIESKSLLAKLMATENLTIEHRKVPTASFDVKNRILTVPILDKNISSEIYDLFMGHEVGHALYTPIEGMLKVKELKINRSVANIVEDSRIERKIKYKYPGLKTSFIKAYRDLIEQDFFGTKNVDMNKLNFIDRINMHCKGGATLQIQFNEEEREILELVENTETYDEVIDVSKKIIDYLNMKEEEKKRLKIKSEGYEESSEEDENNTEQQNDMDFDMDEEDDGESYTSTTNSGSEEDSEEDNESGSGKEFHSYTDETYRQNESKLFDDKTSGYTYVNIPETDTSKIFDHKDLWKKYKMFIQKTNSKISTQEFIKIRNESNKVVSYLVKEFEMRKNADQLKRAATSKTGDLDMNKIFSYQFNEDIFKKISVVPGGKSHGLVMFLDWSGSMIEHLNNTIKQLINLAIFCKKVNIPFEVYAFLETESRNDGLSFKQKPGDLLCSNFRLFNFLSSRMTAGEFSYACSALITISSKKSYYHCNIHIPDWMSMSGTPLNEAVISAFCVIPEFQKKYKLQIVNTVFLTDGEGHTLFEKVISNQDNFETRAEVRAETARTEFFVIRDPVTKHQEVISKKVLHLQQTDSLIRLLRKRTNCNALGFYVIAARDFGRRLYNWFPQQTNHEELKSEFKKNKFTILENTGYNEYYILKSSSLDTEEETTMVVPEKTTTRNLVNAFSKYTNNRISNRVILNRFIGLIA